MPRSLRIALVQPLLPPLEPGESLRAYRDRAIAHLLPLLRRAAEEGARLALLPELVTLPYMATERDRDLVALAEPVPGGPTLEAMAAFARERDVALVVPLFERGQGDAAYNSAVFVGEDGAIRGTYRKQHLPEAPGHWEKSLFKPGELGFPAHPLAGSSVGVIVGEDRHFPEGARELALHGAELVVNPCAAQGRYARALWEHELSAQATAHAVFAAGLNRAGGPFFGKSFVVDPTGRRLAEAPAHEEAVIVLDLDLGLIGSARKALAARNLP